MVELINFLTEHAEASLQNLYSDLSQRAASRLLWVHLNPAHFAMPIHSQNDEARLMALCRSNEDISVATSFLKFEDTRKMMGIARVLARTHINRQGVANVRQGARWPVQSPRVVDLFTLINDEEDLRGWIDYHSLIGAWLKLAYRYKDSDVSDDRRFKESDIASLEKLSNLSADKARSVTVFKAAEMCGNIGWARIVLGFYTGLLYLDERFDFQAEKVWEAIDNSNTADDVDALSLDAQRHVREFGPRLAPSFFADLGSSNFVKADTHVTDVVSAALHLPGEASDRQCIDFVRNLSKNVGWSPRAIDKLMYLACSGKFYLAGIEPSKAQAQIRKRHLLDSLRRL